MSIAWFNLGLVAWIVSFLVPWVYKNQNVVRFESFFGKLVEYAGIGIVDPDNSGKVHAALDPHGIQSIVEGSVVYGISVPARQRWKAIEILKKDSAEKGYRIWFPDKQQ